MTNFKEKLVIYPFVHKVMGAVDLEGRLVIEDDNKPSHWPIGTGDIWNVLMGDKSLNFPSVSDLIQKGF